MGPLLRLVTAVAVLAAGGLVAYLIWRELSGTKPVTAGCPAGQQCLTPPTSVCEALKGAQLSDVNILASVAPQGHLTGVASQGDCASACINLNNSTIGFTYDTSGKNCWCLESPVVGLKSQSGFDAMFFDRSQ